MVEEQIKTAVQILKNLQGAIERRDAVSNLNQRLPPYFVTLDSNPPIMFTDGGAFSTIAKAMQIAIEAEIQELRHSLKNLGIHVE